MRRIGRFLLRLILAAVMAYVSYAAILGVLSLVANATPKSGIGDFAVTAAVYFSPLLWGFPLLILFTLVYLVFLTKKHVFGGRVSSASGNQGAH
jgi:hypothetical protein